MINGGAPCGGPFDDPSTINREANKRVFAEYKNGTNMSSATQYHIWRSISPRSIETSGPRNAPRNTGQTHGHAFCVPDAIGAYELLNRSHLPLDIALDEHLETQ